MTDWDKMEEARDTVEHDFVEDPNSNVHSVGIGFRWVDGVETDEPCVVVKVPKKMCPRDMSAQNIQPIAPYIKIQGAKVRIDVQESPEMSPLLLLLPVGTLNYRATQAGETHRKCFSPTVPGGAQVQPEGANWVGTWGVACKFQSDTGRTVFGGVTNWHVLHGGSGRIGRKIGQPVYGQGSPFGMMNRWKDLRFNGQANDLDISLGLCELNGKHTVSPEQVALGRINPSAKTTVQLGERGIRKDGRTTGTIRNGRVVEIGNSTQVNYGGGKLALFTKQYVIRAESGNFSGPGDSGSHVLDKDNRPVGILFAGGGQDTIVNPILPAIEQFQIEYF